MTLVTALLMLLRSATKITHKAQGVTCLAAKWHVCATLDSFEANESEAPRAPSITARVFPSSHEDSDGDDAGDEEDDLDNSKLIPAYAYSTISFQKRQALGKNVTLLSTQLVRICVVIICLFWWIYFSHASEILWEQPSWDHSIRVHARPEHAPHYFWYRIISRSMATW